MNSLNVFGLVKTVFIILAVGMVTLKCTPSKGDGQEQVQGAQTHQQDKFIGSWIQKSPDPEYKQGFTLYEDGTARSINMNTLLYRKWKYEDHKLVLTSISLGNRSAFVVDEEYEVNSLDDHKLVLSANNNQYTYEKSGTGIDDDPGNIPALSTSFQYFPVDMVDSTEIPSEKHPVDFSENERAKEFESVILDNYEKQDVNFAGYYIVTIWSCGTSCFEGVMIDVRDGRIYDLPTKDGLKDIGNDIKHNRNSTLMITSFTSTTLIPNTSKYEVELNYWLWNESAREFLFYQSETQ